MRKADRLTDRLKNGFKKRERAKSVGTRLGGEGGFTVVELAAVVLLIGIALLFVSLNYADTRRGMALKSATEEVEAAVKRCYSIAGQEGVDVYLQFWNSGPHANQYAILRDYTSVGGSTNEYVEGTPTEPPAGGSSYVTDGSGHYWFKLGEGSVKVQNAVAFLFRREGSVVRVTQVNGGGLSVTLTISNLSKTVSVSEMGKVSY